MKRLAISVVALAMLVIVPQGAIAQEEVPMRAHSYCLSPEGGYQADIVALIESGGVVEQRPPEDCAQPSSSRDDRAVAGQEPDTTMVGFTAHSLVFMNNVTEQFEIGDDASSAETLSGFRTLESLAKDDLRWLERHNPDPCFADLYSDWTDLVSELADVSGATVQAMEDLDVGALEDLLPRMGRWGDEGLALTETLADYDGCYEE